MAASFVNFRVISVSIILTLLLAISNTYLALKVGILTAASIPAAILSMGILKFSRRATLFEHNLIQTAASSGEAIAGGIAYTLPALIIIGFWHNFNYLQTVFLAFTGGVIGVLFSALIRRPLMNDTSLKFPEARAISEVLKLKQEAGLGFKEMLYGSALAAVIEFFQSTNLMFAGAFKLIAQGTALFGIGIGLSPALLGAGFIIGIRIGLSLLFGALISYLLILPLISQQAGFDPHMSMRYVGVGAMLLAAVITLLALIPPLYRHIQKTLGELKIAALVPVSDQDLSMRFIIIGTLLALIILAFIFAQNFMLPSLSFSTALSTMTLAGSLVYVVVIGFIIAVVCAYFSGLVGVSASPGSSVMIAGMILAALLVHALFTLHHSTLNDQELLFGEAITILIASSVMQIACISNDTMQDLKVGQFVGASPKQQQMMLIFGVVIASLIVPLVMQILYQAYGIAGHVPRIGMDLNNTLSAPPAAIMAALTQGIFRGNIPWNNIETGAAVMLAVFLLNQILPKTKKLSLLALGVGMYLPLMSSTPLILGALLNFAVIRHFQKKQLPSSSIHQKTLLACGLVTGATLMDVLLAIPMAFGNGNMIAFNISSVMALIFCLAAMLLLVRMFAKA